MALLLEFLPMLIQSKQLLYMFIRTYNILYNLCLLKAVHYLTDPMSGSLCILLLTDLFITCIFSTGV